MRRRIVLGTTTRPRRSRCSRQARIELAKGNVQQATTLVMQAESTGASFAQGEDSPKFVRALCDASQRFAAGPQPGADPEAYKKGYAQFLMHQSYGLMRYQELALAAEMANRASALDAKFAANEAQPAQLLAQIEQASRQATPPSASLSAPPADELAQRKARAVSYLGRARMAMQSNDVKNAEYWAQMAVNERVPDESFQGGETRPWEVVLQINRMRNQMATGVVQAGGTQAANGQPYPVRSSVYQQGVDPTRNTPAQAIADGANQTGSDAMQLYDQGVAALQSGDRETALSFFREAWKYQEQLDPFARGQLQTKLTMLAGPVAPRQVPQAGGAQPLGGGQGSQIEQLTNEQELLRQKLIRQITQEERDAAKQSVTDPVGALNRLQRLNENIQGEELLDANARRQLSMLLGNSITQLKGYIEQNRAMIENNEANQRIEEQVALDRQRLVQVQDKVKELVDNFNSLMEEQRFSEAEVVAKQAHELAPELPVVQTLLWKSRFARQMASNMALRERKQVSFVDALASVEESSEPYDDRVPMNFNGARRWQELSDRRMRLFGEENAQMTPEELEIRRKLKERVNVKFSEAPLAEVLDTICGLADIPHFIDPRGLKNEGVDTSVPVSINLSHHPISVQSALDLILSQYNLGWVIENEVLKITTSAAKKTKTKTVVYSVADLVIPIPNFVSGYNVGLPSAIREAHMALGYGGGQASTGLPLQFAQQDLQPTGVNGSVLAQMGRSGMIPSMGRGAQQQQFTPGPGGMGGAALADFDTLIELITSTIDPESWLEAGGEGDIREFPTNLSLVIRQTLEVHEQIAQLLEQLRKLQDLQITIEVRFITLNDNFFERIGIDFDFNVDDNSLISASNGVAALPDDIGPRVGFGLNQFGNPTADLDYQFRQDSFAATVPQFGGFDVGTAANFGFAILSDIEVFFLLQAAQGDTRTNVLQAPKVTLFNGQNASVQDQVQRPFVTSIIPVVGDFAAAHQPVITVLSEGTSLSVQGVVSSDRRFVRLTLVPFFSQIGEVRTFTFDGTSTSTSGSNVLDADGNPIAQENSESVTQGTTVQLPSFGFTTVSTTVSVPDGGTVLLGGIKRLREGRNERGVPMLSKMPYINRLFRNVGIGREAQSLMMMVTPHIIIEEEEENKLLGGTP